MWSGCGGFCRKRNSLHHASPATPSILPKNVDISINNTLEAKSGLLYEDGKLVDISLANCYTLEDMIRELIKLMGEYAVPKE